MAEKITTPDPNPKNIIVRNKLFPNQVRRARKSELKWYAERGWRPDGGRQTTDAGPSTEHRTPTT